MADWDLEVDFLVVGSGAAGMSGALRAIDLDQDVLMVEASDLLGGSTAISAPLPGQHSTSPETAPRRSVEPPPQAMAPTGSGRPPSLIGSGVLVRWTGGPRVARPQLYTSPSAESATV